MTQLGKGERRNVRHSSAFLSSPSTLMPGGCFRSCSSLPLFLPRAVPPQSCPFCSPCLTWLRWFFRFNLCVLRPHFCRFLIPAPIHASPTLTHTVRSLLSRFLAISLPVGFPLPFGLHYTRTLCAPCTSPTYARSLLPSSVSLPTPVCLFACVRSCKWAVWIHR